MKRRSDMLNKEDQIWLDETLKKIITKMNGVCERSKNKIPYTTIDGIHDDKRMEGYRIDDGLNWWTNGFWAGMLWLMYHETKEEKYAVIARKTEGWLDQCFDDYSGLHHDVGFMWLPSAIVNYRLTGNEDSRRRGLHAANLLAGRYNPVGRFIRAWNDLPNEESDTRGWAIIDSMLNIPLLYWAYEETKDPRFKHIAMLHADTIMENFIRPDGSSEHIVEFDPEVGGKIKTYGGQGYADGSSWTRGQAWALYGFVMSYMHTEKQAYLDTAKRVAHYFIANIPEDGIIPVDFRQPIEPAYEDSTAAAIAACGLIELAKHVDKSEKEMYIKAALKLLKGLDAKRCSYDHKEDHFLTHCTGAYHSKEHHFSIIYGDYYYLEALLKLKEDDLFIW